MTLVWSTDFAVERLLLYNSRGPVDLMLLYYGQRSTCIKRLWLSDDPSQRVYHLPVTAYWLFRSLTGWSPNLNLPGPECSCSMLLP